MPTQHDPTTAHGPDPGGSHGDEGMASVEYALVTVAAAGLAGLLLAVLRSNTVKELLLSVVTGALGA
ncbi:DUF4244 domain-containing protein [Demequina pelophila]|uniref:DUF4244 domain-containing protein n=1 Tax=Demequina pelophila TaxID=1638984 RepID=UPI0007815ADE|nr:DUF4244 domain-containing protein [Demequina pelophila]